MCNFNRNESLLKPPYHKPQIAAEKLSEFSKINNWKGLWALLCTLLPSAAGLALWAIFPQTWVGVIVWILISARMLAMYALLHDALHYMLFSNRKLNDLTATVFLATPLGISFNRMRNLHLAHHRHLHTDKDPEAVHRKYPEFRFPMPPGKFVRIAILDLSGINSMYYRFSKMQTLLRTGSTFTKGIGTLFQNLLLVSILLLPFWTAFFAAKVVSLWVFASLSGFQFLNRIRLSTEHFMLSSGNAFGTRSVVTGPLTRFLFSPHHLGYHTEHHLYPKVPFYGLPGLQAELLRREEYRKGAEINTSYAALWNRFIANGSQGS